MAHERMDRRDNDDDVDSGKDTEPSSCKSDLSLSSSKPWHTRNTKYKRHRCERAAQRQKDLTAQGLSAPVARNIRNVQKICFAGAPWSGREKDPIITEDAERLKQVHDQSLQAMNRRLS